MNAIRQCIPCAGVAAVSAATPTRGRSEEAVKPAWRRRRPGGCSTSLACDNNGSAAAQIEWSEVPAREFDLISAQAQVAAYEPAPRCVDPARRRGHGDGAQPERHRVGHWAWRNRRSQRLPPRLRAPGIVTRTATAAESPGTSRASASRLRSASSGWLQTREVRQSRQLSRLDLTRTVFVPSAGGGDRARRAPRTPLPRRSGSRRFGTVAGLNHVPARRGVSRARRRRGGARECPARARSPRHRSLAPVIRWRGWGWRARGSLVATRSRAAAPTTTSWQSGRTRTPTCRCSSGRVPSAHGWARRPPPRRRPRGERASRTGRRPAWRRRRTLPADRAARPRQRHDDLPGERHDARPRRRRQAARARARGQPGRA